MAWRLIRPMICSSAASLRTGEKSKALTVTCGEFEIIRWNWCRRRPYPALNEA